MTWAYIPSKSAPELACLAKDCEPGSSTWASRIAPCATLSGKHTQPLSWQRASKKEAWTQLLCGPTYLPSTLQHGMALWIASLRASRAKTSALPESELGLTAPAPGSSSTSSTLPTLAVRAASFWRTSQASLLPPPPLWTRPKANSKSAQPPESWENWPTAGGMRNGSLFQRQTWVPATAGQGGSASRGDQWLTPNVPNGGRSVPPELVASKGMTADGQKRTVGLESQSRYWATPDCNTSTYSNGKMGPNIRQQATQWATPRAGDGEKGGPNQAGSKGDLMLPSMAAQWPTPSAAVMNDAESPESWHARADAIKAKGINGNGAGLPLTIAVKQWPTPASRDYRTPNSMSYAERGGGGMKGEQLVNFVAHSSHLAQPTQHGETSSSSGPNSPRRLSPVFGEWLMGWPLQWTKAEPSASNASATESYRCALQQQLSYLFSEPHR